MKEIDARGLSCPAPVLRAKAAIEKEGTDALVVLVDNAAAQQNVQRFMESKGFTTTMEQDGPDYRVAGQSRASGVNPGQRQHSLEPEPGHRWSEKPDEPRKVMVLCATDRLGFGDETLGQKLMINFIKTLAEMGTDLWRLVFVNNGVKLTIDGSPVLETLQTYETAGVTLLVCGTCLEHFNLLDRKQVGITTNMLDIVTGMQLADKVITI